MASRSSITIPLIVATVMIGFFLGVVAFRSLQQDDPVEIIDAIRVERVFVDEREAICFIRETSLDCEWLDADG